MISKALEWASVFIEVQLWGSIKGHSFVRAFEIKRYIRKCVKMPCKWESLFIGAQLGNLEGICLPGLFERKGKYIWVPFLDPEDIKILSLGAIWKFSKWAGLSGADIRLWGTKDLSIRSRCIGTVIAQTHCKSSSL
jgi:hypothetical protein